MKYFISILLISFFVKVDAKTKKQIESSSRKLSSEIENINLIPIDPEYPSDGFGEGYARKEAPKQVKFLQNVQTIKLMIHSADLLQEVQGWSSFEVDELLLRVYHFELPRAQSFYPQINANKLIRLKKVLIEYESK